MLQIYFDFSGYSDMAIGIGHMFGFHFKENFYYPYHAGSIREFWHRWHISLSGWFREYLYIPLGGSRKGRARTVVNKFVVFACTGLLFIEEFLPFFQTEKTGWKKAAAHIYVIFAVLIGFVFFRADNMGQGINWIIKMFTGIQHNPNATRLVLSLLTPVHLAAFAAGILASAPFAETVGKAKAMQKVLWPASLLLLLLCMLNLAGGTYNPFIYFRF